jgi:hypothetical protein
MKYVLNRLGIALVISLVFTLLILLLGGAVVGTAALLVWLGVPYAIAASLSAVFCTVFFVVGGIALTT